MFQLLIHAIIFSIVLVANDNVSKEADLDKIKKTLENKVYKIQNSKVLNESIVLSKCEKKYRFHLFDNGLAVEHFGKGCKAKDSNQTSWKIIKTDRIFISNGHDREEILDWSDSGFKIKYFSKGKLRIDFYTVVAKL